MKYALLFSSILFFQSIFAQIAFTPEVLYTLPNNSANALDAGCLEDFTGDGRLDYLYAASEFGQSKLWLLVQNNEGTFQASLLQEGMFFKVVQVADIDEDGDQDFLNLFNVFSNNGSNSFAAVEGGTFPVINDDQDRILFATQDMNGDGLFDYATGSNFSIFGDSILVYFANLGGGFDVKGVKASDPEVQGSFNLVGNFQNVAQTGILAAARHRATIYRISADGLSEVATIADNNIDDRAAAIGDVDGDGDNDVVLTGSFPGLYVWEQEPSGFATELRPIANIGSGILNTKLLDIDSDGDLDIVAVRSSIITTVVVFENTGAGQFAQGVQMYSSPPLAGVFYAFGNANENLLDAGDMDGDGDIDIVFFDFGSDQIVLLENTSMPTSTRSLALNTASLRAFPNPAYDFVQIEQPESSDLLVWDSVVLYNQQGKVVQHWSQLPNQIDVRHLPAGEYLLSATSTEQQIFQVRLLHTLAPR